MKGDEGRLGRRPGQTQGEQRGSMLLARIHARAVTRGIQLSSCPSSVSRRSKPALRQPTSHKFRSQGHPNLRNIRSHEIFRSNTPGSIPRSTVLLARVSRPTLRHIRTRPVVSPGQRDTHPRESESTQPSEHARQYFQVNDIPARVSSNRRVPVAGGEGV